MSHYAAQLDAAGVCIAITETPEALAGAHIVAIDAYDLSLLGQTWDGAAWHAPAAPAPVRHITPRALRMRFTSAERVAIEIGMLDDPTAAMAVRQQAAALRAYMGDLAAAQYIDLDDPATVAGVQMLEAAGLIATGRAAAILSQDPQPGELP